METDSETDNFAVFESSRFVITERQTAAIAFCNITSTFQKVKNLY